MGTVTEEAGPGQEVGDVSTPFGGGEGQGSRRGEIRLMSNGSSSTAPAPAPRNWDRTLIYCQLAGLIAASITGGIFLGELRSDLKAVQRDVLALNNPVDSTSLRSAVDRSAYETRVLGIKMFEMVGELHPKANEAAIIGKHRADYDRSVLRRRPLKSPTRTASYVEPSDVIPGMFRFRSPESMHGQRVPVRPILPGRIELIQPTTEQRDPGRTFTVEISHGTGYRTRYMRLASVTKAVGEYVEPEEQFGEVLGSSEFCLRVGLIGPDGKFIDIRPFLESAPNSSLEGAKPEPQKPGPR